jgi:hypothetical protein
MSDWKERLNKAREAARERFYQQGAQAGREWAMHDADFDELERLSDLVNQVSPSGFECLIDRRANSAYAPAERLYFIMSPEQDGDRAVVNDFWERAAGSQFADLVNREGFLEGFVAGAVEIHREFADFPGTESQG